MASNEYRRNVLHGCALEAQVNRFPPPENTGDTTTACTARSDFVSQVCALSSKRIEPAAADAQDLIAKANEIKAVLAARSTMDCKTGNK